MELKDLYRKYSGQHLIFHGEDLKLLWTPRIPTGIFSLDVKTGGGIPEGKITEFYGEKSCFKTTAMFKTADEFIKKYDRKKRVAFFDFEGTFDYDWASNYIEDIDSCFEVLEPDYGEQGVDMMGEVSKINDFGLVIVDSIAGMNPLGISEKSATEDTMGLHPKLVNKMLRKIIPQMSIRRKEDNLLTLAVINQTAANVGARGHAPQVIKPGGKMKEFMYSLDIKFSYLKVSNVNGIPALWDYKFKVEKNKCGIAKTEGEFRVLQTDVEGIGKRGTMIEGPQVLEEAKRIKIIEKSAGGWDIYGKTYKNLDLVKEALKDKEVFEKLRSDTLRALVGNPALIADERRGIEDGDSAEVGQTED